MPPVTAMVLLGLINLLFAVFALVQLWTLAGGARHVIESQGLTFAQYARQGFFQLLWVAGLMFLLMTTVRLILGVVETRRRFQVQFVLAGCLTLAIVAVAVGRLALYIGAFGLTTLRFYTTVFSIWIALAFVLLMAGEFLLTDRRWLTGAVAATAFVFLVGVNLAAPSALIVRDQLNGTDAVDLHTLPGNGDAVAATALWIIEATGDERNLDRAGAQLCANDLLNRTGAIQPLASGSGLDFNLSRRQAAVRQDQVCPQS